MSGFVRSVKMSHCGNDEIGQNALCGRYFNDRRTGKDATKPRKLGLLGHSVMHVLRCGQASICKYTMYLGIYHCKMECYELRLFAHLVL